MKQVNIQTLSPIHIGSGRDLNANIEFLQFNEEEGPVLAIIEEEKVLKIIGQENINHWITIIQNKGDLKEYLIKRKPDLVPNDIAFRIIDLMTERDISNNKILKEQLHNGSNLAYIPGSSIKGAIRTAVLAELAIQNKGIAKKNLKNKKGHFSGQEVEKKLFGSNPNEDVFRFLQIGDAYFEYYTTAERSEVVNLEGGVWKFKFGNSSLIECIPAEVDDVYFNMKINEKLINLNKKTDKASFLEGKELFKIINRHTKKLLNNEIEFWQEQENIAFDVFDIYLENLQELQRIADNCSENEAVLRIGFGSGWNFITGAWPTDEEIMNDWDYENFLKIVRRKNYSDDVPFPKTRMITDNGDLFGFVKLKIEN